MTKPPTVCLHLGFHKTASTYLQDNLASEKNRPHLLENGVEMFHPYTLRKSKLIFHLYRAINRPDQDVHRERFRNICERIMAGRKAERVILSDEAMIGSCWDLARNDAKTLYPRMLPHLRIVSETFSAFPCEVFICLRRMSTYLGSAYVETLRHAHHFMEFDHYVRNIRIDDLDWAQQIDWVKQAFPDAKIHIWEFERLAEGGYLRKVVGKLLGADIHHLLEYTDEGRRTSFPTKVLDILRATRPDLDRLQYKNLVSTLDDPTIAWKDPVKFRPIQGTTQQKLDQRHEAVLATIRKDPRLTLI